MERPWKRQKLLPLEVTEQHANEPSTPASSICHCFSFSPPRLDKSISHKFPDSRGQGQSTTLMNNEGATALCQAFIQLKK